MKVFLCAIGKYENQYIKEWIDYYKKLGINKIYLFDNNIENGEDFRDVIAEEIDSGYVILKNVRGLHGPIQLPLYTMCYNEFKFEYDWFLFFDIDEFLTLPAGISLKSLLADDIYADYNMIHVNWLVYGDCGLVYNDGRPCLERFVEPLPLDKRTTYNFPDNFHVKAMIRGGLDHCKFISPHTAAVPGKCCTLTGNQCEMYSPFAPYDFRRGFLKHFTTKTAQEYAMKIKRGFCDRDWRGNLDEKQRMIDLFFKRNEYTKEKASIFEQIIKGK